MSKNIIKRALIFLSTGLTIHCYAQCDNVYTIGDYDNSLIANGMVIKLGPENAQEVTDNFPKSFLESDGTYGGGEAFCSIERACEVMFQLKNNGTLPYDGNWRIYLLQARWDKDVYQLKNDDYRINKPVKVLQEVHRCNG